MASPGLLLLLLVSSSLLLPTISISEEDHPQDTLRSNKWKAKQGLKATGLFLLKNIDQIRFAVTPFLALLPPEQKVIAAVATSALVAVSTVKNNLNNQDVLEALQHEFQFLHNKMNKYNDEQIWESWNSGAFHKPELNINVAWETYKTVAPSLLRAQTDEEQRKFKEELLKACDKSQPAIKKLREYLTASGVTLTNNLANMLAKHVKCHEKELREFTVFIVTLIYKGNTFNRLCYKLKGIETPEILDREAQYAYDSAAGLFKIHKQCLLDSYVHIKSDVYDLIDPSQNRQELAQRVRSFLADVYDNYDWIVVAYITKNSAHKVVETENKHVLSRRFIKVDRGGVTVAVARQAKGTHTMVDEVGEAINRCFPRSVKCYQVPARLSQCREYVRNIPVTQTYTAVHAYLRKDHQSVEANTVYTNPEQHSPRTPYIHQGRCKKTLGGETGSFVVLIKSDEEIRMQDPCARRRCGGPQRGTCVRVGDTFLAMCDCQPPYYGKDCELSLEDYKRSLGDRLNLQPRQENPRRVRWNSGRRTLIQAAGRTLRTWDSRSRVVRQDSRPVSAVRRSQPAIQDYRRQSGGRGLRSSPGTQDYRRGSGTWNSGSRRGTQD